MSSEKFNLFKVSTKYNEELPESLIYLNNYWILNEGHDYSKFNGNLETSSPEVADSPALIQWGEEIFTKCANGHNLPNTGTRLKFCPECGVEITIE